MSKIIILVVIFTIRVFTINVFALMVQQDSIGIYCIKDNGVRAVNEWVEIDFEGDNYLEYYYFDSNGYLIMNGVTPDGYVVNERGQWIDNGIVQRKYYKIPSPKKSSNDNYNATVKSDGRKARYNNDSNFLFLVFAIVLFLIVLYIKSTTNNNKENKRKKYDNYSAPHKPNYYKKTITTDSNDTTVSRSLWWHLRSDTDKKGEEGEDQVAERLRYLGKDFIVLRNVNLPRINKDPVQIDFLCISNKGIFVIEVKNWLGKITGDYEDEIWHSQINYSVNEQKNPVRQNEWHIDVLKRFIRPNMTYYSIIIFTDRADIGWLDKKQNRSYITNINNLNNLIYSIYESSNVKLYSNYKSVAGYLRKFIV